jgi:uncharacterized DUF497 family protein
MPMPMSDFEWDTAKDSVNRAKYGVGFELAQHAFLDPLRMIAEDLDHGGGERRYFCFGRVEGAVMTVRFTWNEEDMAQRKDQDFRARLLAEGKGHL